MVEDGLVEAIPTLIRTDDPESRSAETSATSWGSVVSDHWERTEVEDRCSALEPKAESASDQTDRYGEPGLEG